MGPRGYSLPPGTSEAGSSKGHLTSLVIGGKEHMSIEPTAQDNRSGKEISSSLVHGCSSALFLETKNWHISWERQALEARWRPTEV